MDRTIGTASKSNVSFDSDDEVTIRVDCSSCGYPIWASVRKDVPTEIICQRYQKHKRCEGVTVVLQSDEGYQLMATAPKNATWIQVKTASGKIIEAHYAQDYSGEIQPAFDGWFDRNLVEIETPVAWKALP